MKHHLSDKQNKTMVLIDIDVLTMDPITDKDAVKYSNILAKFVSFS